MFVESFQGQYKDGTNGTRDFRMASASFFILRILTWVSFYNNSSLWVSSDVQGLLLVCATCIYAVLRPYKHNFRNIADTLSMTLAALEAMSFEIFAAASHPPTVQRAPCHAMVSVSVLGVPHMILLVYMSYLFAKKVGITQWLKTRYKRLKRSVQNIRDTSQCETDVVAESDTGPLPDRMMNPGEYEPLLPTTEEHTAAEPTEDKEWDNEDPRRLTPVYSYSSIN